MTELPFYPFQIPLLTFALLENHTASHESNCCLSHDQDFSCVWRLVSTTSIAILYFLFFCLLEIITLTLVLNTVVIYRHLHLVVMVPGWSLILDLM